MENLNAETVKEWLEICAEDTPYPDQSKALHDALALINSQEQRIKELTEEIRDAKANNVSEIKTRFAMRFGTYTDKDMTPIIEVFWLLDQITKELLGGV